MLGMCVCMDTLNASEESSRGRHFLICNSVILNLYNYLASSLIEYTKISSISIEFRVYLVYIRGKEIYYFVHFLSEKTDFRDIILRSSKRFSTLCLFFIQRIVYYHLYILYIIAVDKTLPLLARYGQCYLITFCCFSWSLFLLSYWFWEIY